MLMTKEIADRPRQKDAQSAANDACEINGGEARLGAWGIDVARMVNSQEAVAKPCAGAVLAEF
jgi:hypothetical protein